MSPEEAKRLARSSFRPFPNHRPTFHKDIAARVKDKGISQIDLAKQLGVSPSRLSDWLAGRRSMPMAAVEQAVGLLGGKVIVARVEWDPLRGTIADCIEKAKPGDVIYVDEGGAKILGEGE